MLYNTAMRQGTLVSWVGERDFLFASGGVDAPASCPFQNAITHLLEAGNLDRVVLLHDADRPERGRRIADFKAWMTKTWPTVQVESHEIDGAGVESSYAALHSRVAPIVDEVLDRPAAAPIAINGSSGRPIVHGVFMTIATARPRVQLLHCWRPGEVIELELPDSILVQFGRAARGRVIHRFTSDRTTADAAADEFKAIIGDSSNMKQTIALAHRFAIAGDQPVLLLGETGTGKELLAHAIHAASPRGETSDGRRRPLVSINCGALPESLIESELFGHVKGAFTGADRDKKGLFEQADGGTIFLDEIGDLPLSLQVRLLRVLNDGEVRPVGSSTARRVDVRVVAATHQDLRGMINDGSFRQDLWYRIAVCPLHIPPLRERGDDLVQIITYEWDRLIPSLGAGIDAQTLSRGAMDALKAHTWPGNVRELKATLARIAITSTKERVPREHVELAIDPVHTSADDSILDRPLVLGRFSIEETIAEVARHYLRRAHTMTAGNKSEAARLLGLKGANSKFTEWAKRYNADL